MTYQPVVLGGGAAGWAFLQRTRVAQQTAFETSREVKNDTTYFKEKIGSITSSEDLVEDRRLLRVALGAYGLDDDIANTYFVKKVLDDGTLDTGDLANRLSDKRYLEFSKDFGFGDYDIPRTQISTFGADIVDAYHERQFEIAVGNQNEDMRLAMTLNRELPDILKKSSSDDTKWFSIMGNPPLRKAFETALDLPPSIGTLDLDRQLAIFRDKAERYFGETTVDQFSDSSKMDELSRLFLVRSQISSGNASLSSGSIALTLLRNL